MVGWGIFLIILGAGSLLLPMLDLQFRLMELVDDYQPYAGIVVAVIGVALVLLGMNRHPDAATAESWHESPPGDPARPAPDEADRRP
jgi:hypothetical protein